MEKPSDPTSGAVNDRGIPASFRAFLLGGTEVTKDSDSFIGSFAKPQRELVLFGQREG